jgi:hypothetical protein
LIVDLFATGQQGKSRTVSSQTHTNLYAEISSDKSRLAFYCPPGLTLDYTYGDTPVRGSIGVGDVKYEVHRGTFWEVDNAGSKTNRGTLNTTSGKVEMSYNGSQVGIVDGTNMYCFTVSGASFVVVSSGLFSNPVSITYGNSYFIVGFADGRFQTSDVYDGTVFDALDYATAEQNPDGLVKVVVDHGELLILGENTTEPWAVNPGQGFTYVAIGSSAMEFGLAAQFSLTKYQDSLAGLFKNTMGEVQVMQMQGHRFVPISTPEMDSIFNGYDTVADATAYSYMRGGHPMFQINFPSAGKSWLYDAHSGMWSPLKYGLNETRHRGEIRTDFLNKPRVTDYENGNVYTLDPDVFTDNGTAIPREIISKHFFKDAKRVSISSLHVEFEPGVGLATGQGSDPMAMLQISRDGGFTWGNEMWTTIGKVGKYENRAIWRRLGSGRDFVFRIRVTDPVKVVITNAYIEAEVGN